MEIWKSLTRRGLSTFFLSQKKKKEKSNKFSESAKHVLLRRKEKRYSKEIKENKSTSGFSISRKKIQKLMSKSQRLLTLEENSLILREKKEKCEEN